jgi:tRNA pseudouridine55 synthase
MDGIINLNKPIGLTSAKALAQVRQIVGQRKSGHAGTLDPLADGVLVLCLGRATKLVEALMDQPKVYRTIAALDVTSPGFDLELPTTPVAVDQPPSEAEILAALRSFEGRIEQVPPATSAVKIGGRPAYELSRAGQTPRLSSRPVEVHWIHLRRYEWPEVEFELACGRGTYVRALIRDIGQRLGTGGCLTKLTRLAVGPFRIDESWSLAELALAAGPTAALVPLEQARALATARPVRIPPRPGEAGL